MAGDNSQKLAMFIDITGSDDGIAMQMLENTCWDVEDAVQIFFASGGLDTGPSSEAPPAPPAVHQPARSERNMDPFAPAGAVGSSGRTDAARRETSEYMGEDGVRAPLPVKREALYGPASYTYSGHGALGSGSGSGAAGGSQHQGGWGPNGQQLNLGAGIPNPLLPSSAFLSQQGSSQAQTGPPPVDAFRDFGQEAAERAAVRAGEGGSASGGGKTNLAAMYKPPFDLLCTGGFEDAKAQAASHQRWLIVNVQSQSEFASHMLNRDLWGEDMVKTIVSSNFTLWQVDNATVDGRKVCTYYSLHKLPATLVLHPRTGQKKKVWEGFIPPEQFLEDMMPFIDEPPTASRGGAPPPPKKQRDRDPTPSPPAIQPQATGLSALAQQEDTPLDEDEQLQMALAASLEPIDAPLTSSKELASPSTEGMSLSSAVGALREDPTAGQSVQQQVHGGVGDKEAAAAVMEQMPDEPPAGPSACTIAFRWPDGRRDRRRFLLSDSVKILDLYCRSVVPEAGSGRPFRLVPGFPGASPLDLQSESSVEENNLNNSVLVFNWT